MSVRGSELDAMGLLRALQCGLQEEVAHTDVLRETWELLARVAMSHPNELLEMLNSDSFVKLLTR
jgi:hypothetical protein